MKKTGKKRQVLRVFLLSISACALLVWAGCGNKERYVQLQTSQIFIQDFNPEYLDILWVIDNRSSLYAYRSALVAEAKRFFTRLDQMTSNYQMGFIASDMLISKGQLQPDGKPAVIKRGVGDIEQRTALFGVALTQVIVNLHTDGESKGFAAAEAALKQYFIPRAGVPLVLIFISDSDDHSESADPALQPVDYFTRTFSTLKNANTNLLKVYAINYVKGGERCTDSHYDADIDSTRVFPDGTPYFQDRYFQLTKKLSGETADICGSFADKISLDGLRLKELPRRFKLEKKAKPGSISLNIFRGSEEFNDLKHSFDTDTNELVFEQAPPQGVTIQISYEPG